MICPAVADPLAHQSSLTYSSARHQIWMRCCCCCYYYYYYYCCARCVQERRAPDEVQRERAHAVREQVPVRALGAPVPPAPAPVPAASLPLPHRASASASRFRDSAAALVRGAARAPARRADARARRLRALRRARPTPARHAPAYVHLLLVPLCPIHLRVLHNVLLANAKPNALRVRVCLSDADALNHSVQCSAYRDKHSA